VWRTVAKKEVQWVDWMAPKKAAAMAARTDRLLAGVLDDHLVYWSALPTVAKKAL
jgi:hypothetical protein